MFHLYDKISRGETFIIAEMSANHGGSLESALEIVRGAKKAGADCLKIQTYTADSMTIDCDGDYFIIKGGLWDGYKLYDLYKEAGTPYDWQPIIKKECEKIGIDFLSTPFDKGAVDFLEDMGVEAYKIASFEFTDIPLIEYTASKGKPMIMSTGMANLMEIQDAIDACRKVGNEKIVLLKCCSEYPSPWDDMHLGNIPDMRERFGYPVGLSDHSNGSIGAIVGVSLGACIVEKHIMLENVNGVDAGFSMLMDDFAGMVQGIRAAEKIKKGPDYELTEGEKSQLVFRRSIFAVKDIEEGEEFSEENIRIIRPGYGASPSKYGEILRKKSTKSIKRGEPIRIDEQ